MIYLRNVQSHCLKALQPLQQYYCLLIQLLVVTSHIVPSFQTKVNLQSLYIPSMHSSPHPAIPYSYESFSPFLLPPSLALTLALQLRDNVAEVSYNVLHILVSQFRMQWQCHLVLKQMKSIRIILNIKSKRFICCHHR